jgi:hypothetical protein
VFPTLSLVFLPPLLIHLIHIIRVWQDMSEIDTTNQAVQELLRVADRSIKKEVERRLLFLDSGAEKLREWFVKVHDLFGVSLP